MLKKQKDRRMDATAAVARLPSCRYMYETGRPAKRLQETVSWRVGDGYVTWGLSQSALLEGALAADSCPVVFLRRNRGAFGGYLGGMKVGPRALLPWTVAIFSAFRPDPESGPGTSSNSEAPISTSMDLLGTCRRDTAASYTQCEVSFPPSLRPPKKDI